MKKNLAVFILMTLICLAVFLTHYFIVGTAVYGDGKYYYEITRSIVIEKNIANNKYPPGVSLLWLPTFFITHLIFSGDGFSFPYQVAVGLTSILSVVIGLYFLYKTLSNYFSEKISLLTVLFTIFGTNLFFYSAVDVINSHGISFAISSIILYLLLIYKPENKLKKWVLLGLASGFLGLTRTQDFILLIPVIYFIFKQKTKISYVLSYLISLLIAFSPQLLFWKIIYGSLSSPYLKEGFNFLRPQIFGVLFNTDTGLVLWTPLVAIAILGLFFSKFKKLFLLTVFLQLYFIASWSSWNQGGSFGIRMLISSLPFIAFGFAEIVKRIKNVNLYLFFFLATILNSSLILYYLLTH